jgi:hypothetical protein
MLIESVKAALRECAHLSSKDEARLKFNSVARWLLAVSCCTGFEAVHGDIAGLAEVPLERRALSFSNPPFFYYSS